MISGKIAIGLVRTSFGLKGEVKVASLSGDVDHFLVLKKIFLKDKQQRMRLFTVESVRKHKGMVLLKLEGINTPEEGKKLGGFEVWVNREYASSKAEDEYYLADICACSVYLEEKEFGRIKSVIEGNAVELLEIETIGGGVILIPFIEKFVGTVDITQLKIFLKEESSLL